MEEIFSCIDDVTKRMNRPIKDLDDIRIVMGSLKEIREKQIDIDMMIMPIEVRKTILNSSSYVPDILYASRPSTTTWIVCLPHQHEA